MRADLGTDLTEQIPYRPVAKVLTFLHVLKKLESGKPENNR